MNIEEIKKELSIFSSIIISGTGACHSLHKVLLIIPYLLVELNVLQDFDGLVIITEQRVKPQESHQAEVTQHLVQGVASILPSHTLWVSCNTSTNNMLAASFNT